MNPNRKSQPAQCKATSSPALRSSGGHSVKCQMPSKCSVSLGRKQVAAKAAGKATDQFVLQKRRHIGLACGFASIDLAGLGHVPMEYNAIQ